MLSCSTVDSPHLFRFPERFGAGTCRQRAAHPPPLDQTEPVGTTTTLPLTHTHIHTRPARS